MRHIQRLVIVEAIDRSLPIMCLEAMPSLKHLDINGYVNDVAPLLRLKHSLEVLRMKPYVNAGMAGTFERVLSQMSSLRLLVSFWAGHKLMIPYAIDWSELKLSASLRSIAIIGVDPGTAADVVAFLTSEVDNRGNAVARQHLLDDFTVIGRTQNFPDASINGVYSSEALSPRMKDRIFSYLTPGHVTSALLLFVRRSDYGYCEMTGSVMTWANIILCRTGYQQPQPILLSVLLDMTRNSFPLNANFYNALTIMHGLLRTKDCVKMYDPRIILCVEETDIRIGQVVNKRGPILRAATSLTDERDSITGGPYDILIRLTPMMTPHSRFLESVFLKHIKKLKQTSLLNLFKEIEMKLCRLFLKLVHGVTNDGGPVSFHVLSACRRVEVSDDMIELLTIVKEKATEEVADLLVAANAVLRRCTSMPLSDALFNNNDGLKEQDLFRRLFPRCGGIRILYQPNV